MRHPKPIISPDMAAACYERKADHLDSIWEAVIWYLSHTEATYETTLKKFSTVTKAQLTWAIQELKEYATHATEERLNTQT